MPDLISQQDRKARKAHTCSYCNGTIKKGEIYEHSKLAYEGEIYEWKSHKDCSMVANELWEFIDMTGDDFSESCRAFCDAFICPGCEKYNTEEYDGECGADNYYCPDKITEVLKKYELRQVKDTKGWLCTFKLFERKSKEDADGTKN